MQSPNHKDCVTVEIFLGLTVGCLILCYSCDLSWWLASCLAHSEVPHLPDFLLGGRKLEWGWAWRQTLMRKCVTPSMQEVHVEAQAYSFALCQWLWCSFSGAVEWYHKRTNCHMWLYASLSPSVKSKRNFFLRPQVHYEKNEFFYLL